MVLCKLYQRRCCYFESQCPNEHVHVRDTIEADIQEAVNGKQWPLSSYGPFSYKPSLPNFIEDQSFEEVRMSFYETKLKNFYGQNHEKYKKDVQDARNKMKPITRLVYVASNLYDESQNFSQTISSGTLTQNFSFSNNINPFAVEPNNTNNPFGITNTSGATSKQVPLTMQLPNNASNITNSASSSAKHDPSTRTSSLNIPLGITNSASTPKALLSTNVNSNLLGKKTSSNIFGIKNVAAAELEPSIGVEPNNTNNPFGITNTSSATSKQVPLTMQLQNNASGITEKKTLNNIFGIQNVSGAKLGPSILRSTSNNSNDTFEIAQAACVNSNAVPLTIKSPFGIEKVADINSKPNNLTYNETNQSLFNRQPPVPSSNFNINNLAGKENKRKPGPSSVTIPLTMQSLNINSESPSGMENSSTNLNNYKLLGKDDDSITKKIDKSIMDLILVDMLPYSIVDGTAFKRLQFADPTTKSGYKQKKDVFFHETLMPVTYKNVKEKMMAMIKTTKWISITVNNWSSPDNSNILVTFTAHFLQGSLRKKLVLAAKVLENDQIDSYTLPEIINNFNLEEKLHVAVCNNVHNLETTEITTFECVAHTIHLIVYDIMFNVKVIREVLEKCRKECFIKDDATNWRSTYLMIKTFVEQKTAVTFYSNEKGGVENFTAEEWSILKRILEDLESIYDATSDLSANTATISLIIPLMEMLESKLNEGYVVNNRLVQNDLKLALKERFKFIETSPLLIMSTLLDPRFKNKYLSITQMAIADKEMSTFLQNDSKNSGQTSNKEDERKSNSTLWEKHDATIETDMSLRNELSLYIHEPLVKRSSNIYEYWYTSRYENLKKIAEKYLAVPPTLVENDEMLRVAGRLYADRKSTLKGVKAEDLLFCHFNIKLLDFDY